MGREVRMVPPNWKHPKETKFNLLKRIEVTNYVPMFDRCVEDEMADWLSEFQEWKATGKAAHDAEYSADYGDHELYRSFCEWHGAPPDPTSYRPSWDETLATWFQVYETVSEGTPVSPPFETQKELVDYLCENGDFWGQKRREEGCTIMNTKPWGREQAEAFVFGTQWAPSFGHKRRRQMKVFTALAAIFLALTAHAGPAKTVAMIGNSLTADIRPDLLGADRALYCNQNLEFAFHNPDSTCTTAAQPWPQMLAERQYSFVTVQPFYGTTLKQDVTVIAHWMALQPRSVFVIHTGWTWHTLHADAYQTDEGYVMSHAPGYFERLRDDLKDEHPNRVILINPALQALEAIRLDILAGVGPFTAFDQLYRDQIHMTKTEGRYLQHNLMRRTLGMPRSVAGFESVPDAHMQYLNNVIDYVTKKREPEPARTIWLNHYRG